MKVKEYKKILGCILGILLLFCWFGYCYSFSDDKEENITIVHNNSSRFLPAFLSLSSDSNYFENLEVVEEDISLVQDEEENDDAVVEEVTSEDSSLEEVLETEEIVDDSVSETYYIEEAYYDNSSDINYNYVFDNSSDKNGVADLDYWSIPITGNYLITTEYSSYHKGVDFYSYNGYDSDILASNNGVIYSVNRGCHAGDSSCNGGRGNYLIINHNNGEYYTLYMHLHYIYVDVGYTVNRGDVIASMGNTGHVFPAPSYDNPHSGTHLHFEVYIGIPDRGGYTINPLSLL